MGFKEVQNEGTPNVILVHVAQAMDKYEETALKLIDYELKKYDHWKTEMEHSLPLLMKRPLLALLTNESPSQVHLVGFTHNVHCSKAFS